MPRQVKSKPVEQVAEQVKVEPEVKMELSQSKSLKRLK